MEFDTASFFMALLIGFFILYVFGCEIDIAYKVKSKGCTGELCHPLATEEK